MIALSTLFFAILTWRFEFLLYSLMTTRDWQARKFYADHVGHLTKADATAALARNMKILAHFIQKMPPVPNYKAADHALIMATVLVAVLDRQNAKRPSTYLASRRRLWNQAKRMTLRHDPPFDH